MTQTTPLNWKLNSEAPCTGSSLAKELPGVTNQRIQKLFGVLPSGVCAHEKYSDHLVLTNEVEGHHGETADVDFWNGLKGVYTLYTCYGEWRIGATANSKFVEELAAYIMDTKSKPLSK